MKKMLLPYERVYALIDSVYMENHVPHEHFTLNHNRSLDLRDGLIAYIAGLEFCITELKALAEKLADEGCVIAERFSRQGGSEDDLEGWENVLDDYRELLPEDE